MITQPVTQATTGAGTTKTKSPDKDQFMKLLLEQLTHQNPLEPMNSQEMMQQMVGIETVDRIQSLDTQIKSLGKTMAWQSASLVGRQVELQNLDDPSHPISGQVERVKIKDSDVSLVINGKEYSAALLNAVK